MNEQTIPIKSQFERERKKKRVNNSLPASATPKALQAGRKFFNSYFIKTAVILFCVGFLFFQPKSASATSWLTGWSYRQQITILNTNVVSDLANFPLFVKITETGGGSTNIGYNVSDVTNGYDIRFTDSDGTTLLPYEKESFSVTSNNLTANFWVKVPSINHASGATIYIYYTNLNQTSSD